MVFLILKLFFFCIRKLPADLWRLSKLKSLNFFNTPAYSRLEKEIRGTTAAAGGGDATFNRHHHANSMPSSHQMLNTKTVIEYLKSLPRR